MKLCDSVYDYWFHVSCFYDEAKAWLLASLAWLAAMGIAKLIDVMGYVAGWFKK